MDISELESLWEYKLCLWLNTPEDDEMYNRRRLEFESINKILIDYNNSREERKTKILAAVISGGIGLLGIGASIIVSNSSLGPKFDNAMRGISGRITGSKF